MKEEIKPDCDEITCIYKINKDKVDIRIFGEKFVENNKNHCKIIYNKKEHALVGTFKVENINGDELSIKLKGIMNITNASYLFYECSSLLYIPDISKWDTKNVTDMSFMLYECKSI